MCLIVVGALPPLCFLFSVFQNARPPRPARHPEAARPPTRREIKNARPSADLPGRENLFNRQQLVLTEVNHRRF